MQPQSAARLRCDPTEYARKQQEKRERAKDLRDQRQRGFCSDEHTFAPKVNPRAPAVTREENDASGAPPSQPRSFDDTPIRPSKSSAAAPRKEPLPEAAPMRAGKRQPAVAMATAAGSRLAATSSLRPHNNNHADGEEAADALDALSRRFPAKKAAAASSVRDDYEPAPLEPEDDTLFREVKRATGKALDELPIRNSGSLGGMRAEPLARRRQVRAPTPTDTDQFSPQPQSASARSYESQSDMESSLTLLKSKMSRRKSRSAPTNPSASLFIEKNLATSARTASFAPSSQQQQQQQQQRYSPPPQQQPVPPRSNAAPRGQAPAERQTPPQLPQRRSNASTQQRKQQPREDEDDGGAPANAARYPPPISSGFNQASELDEYADEEEELVQCGNCSRSFNATSLAKHQKICEKVFSGQRKVFNMTAKRLEGTEAEKIAAKAARSAGGGKKAPLSAAEQPIKPKVSDWKQKSDMFRNAMKASRDVSKALKEGKELPPMAPSAPDPSLIQCEFCSRRFNDKAAERHIPFCREKAQRMGTGPAKKGGAPAPAAAKPSRAPARKK